MNNVCVRAHGEPLNKSNQIFFSALNFLICFISGGYTTVGCVQFDSIKGGCCL